MSNAEFGIVYILIGMLWFIYALFTSKAPPEGFLFVNCCGWPVPLVAHLFFLFGKDSKYNTVRDYSTCPTTPTRWF